MTPVRRQLCAFLAPWGVGLVILTAIPMIGSLLLSLTSWNGLTKASQTQWVGTANYRSLLGLESAALVAQDVPLSSRLLRGQPGDTRFYKALSNTILFSVVAVPLGLLASLAVAALLSVPLPGARLFRALVYLPHLLGGVATLLIWSWLLNPQFGWINEMIRCVFQLIDPFVKSFCGSGTADWPVPSWLYSPTWCKPAIMLVHVWTFGASVLIFIAAIRRIPRPLLDAATIDGAGPWQRFKNIAWPHLTPVVLFTYIVGMIFAMQTFNESYLLQNRAQQDGLLFLATYLYESAFSAPHRLGYASAIGWIMCLATALLVLPAIAFSRKWVFESGGRR